MPDDTAPGEKKSESSSTPSQNQPTQEPSLPGGFESYPPSSSTETPQMPDTPSISEKPQEEQALNFKEPTTSEASNSSISSDPEPTLPKFGEPTQPQVSPELSIPKPPSLVDPMSNLADFKIPQITESPLQPPVPIGSSSAESLNPPQNQEKQISSDGGSNFLAKLKKIVLILAVLGILGAGGFFGYQFYLSRQSGGVGEEEPTPSPGVSPGATSAVAPSPTSKPLSGVYQNSQNGFTVEPPAGWKEIPATVGEIVIFQNPQSDQDQLGKPVNALVSIAKKSLAVNETFDQFVEKVKGDNSSLSSFKKLTEVSGSLAGSEANQMDFTWKKDGVDIYQRQILLVKEKDVYVLLATATSSTWGKHQPTFEKSLGSFKFIPKQS